MSLNRLLTDKDRQLYEPYNRLFWDTCPDMMARKFPRANVQQFFVFDVVSKLLNTIPQNPSVLSVGCYEDTAFEVLRTQHKNVIGIDPMIDYDLASYKSLFPDTKFNIVFSTSVIEHVENDGLFFNDICQLIKPGGYGILTMDFNNDYKVGDRLPYTDVRFYTKQDMERLIYILDAHNCVLVDEPDWNGAPDFEYDGCLYSFSTFVFRKSL